MLLTVLNVLIALQYHDQLSPETSRLSEAFNALLGISIEIVTGVGQKLPGVFQISIWPMLVTLIVSASALWAYRASSF